MPGKVLITFPLDKKESLLYLMNKFHEISGSRGKYVSYVLSLAKKEEKEEKIIRLS